MNEQRKDKIFNYQIIKHIATIYEKGGFTKELNLIKYEKAKDSKYDLRLWNTDGNTKTMRKGITLSVEEVKALKKALNTIQL